MSTKGETPSVTYEMQARKIPTMSDRRLKRELCTAAPIWCLGGRMHCPTPCRYGEEARRRVERGEWDPQPYARTKDKRTYADRKKEAAACSSGN